MLTIFLAMKEDKYALAMFDPDRNYLFWLLTDIPSGALAAGTLTTESNQIAEYIPPTPIESDPCLYVVLMLLKQPGPQHTSELSRFYTKDHGLRSKQCSGHCVYRYIHVRDFVLQEFLEAVSISLNLNRFTG